MKIFLFTKEALLGEVRRAIIARKKTSCGYDGHLGVYWMRKY